MAPCMIGAIHATVKYSSSRGIPSAWWEVRLWGEAPLLHLHPTPSRKAQGTHALVLQQIPRSAAAQKQHL